MQIPIGAIHPEYSFDIEIKENVYQYIFDSLGKEVRKVLTFPGLSNYKMEREIIKRYPEVRVYCFEKDYEEYVRIGTSFYKPPEVELINGDAEEYLSGVDDQFDLIFFDYCGGPHDDISLLVSQHLTVDGIYAQTESKRCSHPPIRNRNLKAVKGTIHYRQMKVEVFRKIVEEDGVVFGNLEDTLNLQDIKFIRPRSSYSTPSRSFPRPRSFPRRELRCNALEFDLDEVSNLYRSVGDILTDRERLVIESLKEEVDHIHPCTLEIVSMAIGRMKMATGIGCKVEFSKLREFFDDYMVGVYSIGVYSPSFDIAARVMNESMSCSGPGKSSADKVLDRWGVIKSKIREVMKFPAYSFLREYYNCMVQSDMLRESLAT
jgi:hypothetical protein